MEPYEYNFNFEEHDDRAKFANRVCKLLIQASDKDYEKAVKQLDDIYEFFQEHVRNVYELIWHEIPLFGLYELYKYEPSNWGFTQEEYESAKLRSRKACEVFYI
jgi:hypothetical protein